MSDRIEIRRLRVMTRVGVPDEERSERQKVEISVLMKPERRLSELEDSLERTVDYHAVSQRIIGIAGEGERRLIETLADEIAGMVIDEFAVRKVTVELRKFVLPETEFVAVRVERRIHGG